MSEFVDVPGASGTLYRFRRATMGELPVMAGNVIALSGGEARPRVLLCATARSLSAATPSLRDALGRKRSATLYVRLNIARAARDAEHADIVTQAKPQLVLEDLG